MVESLSLNRRGLLGRGLGLALLLPQGVAAAARSHPKTLHVAPLIMLDPGHGGKDPGAIGVTGTYEKHIAFAAAEELGRRLQASGRYRVRLTRGQDVFIPLEERVAMAQGQQAALFISIHADAVADRGVRGASVYTLADQASDAQTALLAQHENAADRYGSAIAPGLPPRIVAILGSLVRHETRIGSAHMQRAVVASLGHDIPMLENPARHAGFAVLKAATIPSVLVEMGFMSNRLDEAALRGSAYRTRVVTALQRSVDSYFASGAPIAPANG